MKIDKMYISELIFIRSEARKNKNFKLSDEIRNYLDGKNTFIFDTKDGQVVHYELDGMTRDGLVEKINKNKIAEANFDAWLFSIKKSLEIKNKKIRKKLK